MEIDFRNNKIGLVWSGPNGIGDSIIKSSIPENFYKNFNNKLIDINKHWIFDHNPYIDRISKPDLCIDLFKDQLLIIDKNLRAAHKSNASEYCWNYKIPKIFLRHPRLYKFEGETQNLNRLVVHVKGTTNGVMPQHVIDSIPANYSNYEIIQIGMPNEPKIKGAIDKTGLSIWDTVKIISSAAIYIGVDSGFYHVANCYPRVRKKIVLNFELEKLEKLVPLNLQIDGSFVWLDYNIEYFNTYDLDVGITNSFLKI